MKKLEECNWKAFKLKELFDPDKGNQTDMNSLQAGDVPLVSARKVNNGLKSFVDTQKLYRGHCVTLNNDGDGGAGLAYYQPFDFALDSHVTALYPKQELSKYILVFLSHCISKQKEFFGHGHSINSNRLNSFTIMLPVNSKEEPDYAFMEEYMREVEKRQKEKYKSYIQKKIEELGNVEKLEDKEWKAFNIDDIFIVGSGVRLTKDNQKIGNRPFIGSTDSNNGITEFVSNTNESLDRNVLGVNYNGSVVENFYHPYEAVFSDDVKRLHLKNFADNKFVYLFIKSAILQQKVKYQYGYKFNGERMKRQSIMLPINSDGEPDYVFMENYMKRKEMEMLKRYVGRIGE